MIGRPNDATIGKYEGEGRWMESSSTGTTSVSVTGSLTRRPASSSVYLRCQKSSTACTTGTSAKLYAGIGVGNDHSNVRASHGSGPTSIRFRRDDTTL